MRIAHTVSTLILAVAAVAAAAPTAGGFEDETKPVERIAELKQEISILNLLNGLHLTDEQQAAVLEEARNAQALRERYQQFHSLTLSQAEDAFTQLRSQLMNPEAPPSREVEARASRENRDLKQAHERYLRELSRIEERVADILTDGQKQIIEDFKPCLLPPKNLKNPTRAGQANDHTHAERILSRSRSWSNEKYDRRAEAFLDRYISRLEQKHGPMSDEDARAERERVRAIVEEARAMDDVEFELAKKEMAERIDSNGQFSQPRNNLLVSSSKRPGKISRFLLSRHSIPLLEERVALASGPRLITTTKLDSVTPAEDCRVQCGSK